MEAAALTAKSEHFCGRSQRFKPDAVRVTAGAEHVDAYSKLSAQPFDGMWR
jgi:hypothetical protein